MTLKTCFYLIEDMQTEEDILSGRNLGFRIKKGYIQVFATRLKMIKILSLILPKKVDVVLL